MAQHHLALAQSPAAGRFHIIPLQGSTQIQAQRGSEGAAQQQGQSSYRKREMAQGSLQRRHVEAADAVQQVETCAFRGHEAGGKTTSDGEPAQAHGKQQLQQHRHPEGRQGIGAQAVETAGQIQLPLWPGDAAEANAKTEESGEPQSDHAQFEAGGQRPVDDLAHRLLVDQSLAQIAMHQTAQIVDVLLQQRLVQPQPRSHGGFRGCGGTAAEHGVHRIPRGDPQQQKDQAGDQPEHQGGQPQTGGAVAQQSSSASHQCSSSLRVARRSAARRR